MAIKSRSIGGLFKLLRKRSRPQFLGTYSIRDKVFERYLRQQYGVGKKYTRKGELVPGKRIKPNWRFGKPPKSAYKTKKGKEAYGFGLGIQYGVYGSGYIPNGKLKKERRRKGIPTVTPFIEPSLQLPPHVFDGSQVPSTKYHRGEIEVEVGFHQNPVAFLAHNDVIIPYYSERPPNFYNAASKLILKGQMTGRDEKKYGLDPGSTEVFNLLGKDMAYINKMVSMMEGGGHELNAFAESFGRSLGYGTKPFIKKYGELFRIAIAEDRLKNRKRYSEHEIREAIAYLAIAPGLGTPKLGKQEFNVLYATSKVINEYDKVSRGILKDLKDSLPQGLKSYADTLYKDLKRNNDMLMRDFMYARYVGGEKYIEAMNALKESASFEGLDRQLEIDFNVKAIEEGTSRFAKLAAKHGKMDYAYAVARRRARHAYSELIQYIKLNSDHFIDPVNIESLKKSKNFRPIFFDTLEPVIGKEETARLGSDVIMKEKGYRILDPRRMEEKAKKYHLITTYENKRYGQIKSLPTTVSEVNKKVFKHTTRDYKDKDKRKKMESRLNKRMKKLGR